MTSTNHILKTSTGRIAYETVLCDFHFNNSDDAIVLAIRQAELDVDIRHWSLIEARDTECVYCSIQEETVRVQ